MNPHRNPSKEMREKIETWMADPANRGKDVHTCPCGFEGWSNNIRSHRASCPLWLAYAFKDSWKTTNPRER